MQMLAGIGPRRVGSSLLLVTLFGCHPFGADHQGDSPMQDDQALLTGALDISVASQHACALMNDHTVQCWGDNRWGQLGDGTTTARLRPTLVSGLSNVTGISVGSLLLPLLFNTYSFSCALKSDGSVWCWGADNFGQLGDAKPQQFQTRPVRVYMPLAVQISAGGGHACARINDGTVQCWGYNSDGQLGYGGQGTEWDTPIVVGHDTGVLRNVAKVVAGALNTCAILLDNTMACWGNNRYNSSLFCRSGGLIGCGSLTSGLGARYYSPLGVQIGPASLGRDKVSELALGGLGGGGLECHSTGGGCQWVWGTEYGSFGCAKLLQSDQSVWCWGSNYNGQMGNGSTDWSTSDRVTDPTKMHADAMSGINLSGISLGGNFGLSVRNDGSLVAWGAENFGVLADGDAVGYDARSCVERPATCRAHPIATQGGFRKVAAGAGSACGIRTDGSVDCWGLNSSGQLGNGSTNNSAVPVPAADTTAPPRIVSETLGVPPYTANAVYLNNWITIWGSNFCSSPQVYVGGFLESGSLVGSNQINAFVYPNTPRDATAVTVVCNGQSSNAWPIRIPTCWLTGPSAAPVGQCGYWSGTSNPQGYQAYWYGTKNGSQDAFGLYAGRTNFGFNACYDASQRGSYTRYLKLKDDSGNEVCTTNTVSMSVY